MLYNGCERDSFITNSSARISFSMDTLYFDTVFTEVGTITRHFTIRNPHKDFIRISQLELARGENSVFRMNVDGVNGLLFNDIEIPPNDSIFVFVEATLDPNGMDAMMIQQDSIMAITNGNYQDIDLVAWGQDVHFISCDPQDSLTWIRSNETWINDKPYLVKDYAIVDEDVILNIDPGVRVYFYRDAAMYVLGQLQVNGAYGDSVVFQGARLEKMYQDIPGQWGGIIFYPGSMGNVINYADIRCGIYGIVLATTDDEAQTVPSAEIELSNTSIMHMSAFGIRAASGKIRGSNNVFANIGTSALYLEWGGDYRFVHCTIANRWLYSPIRNTPSVYLSNYVPVQDESGNIIPYARDLSQAYFGNSIIWGSLDNELIVNMDPSKMGEYYFDHCITKFNPGEDGGYSLSSNSRINEIINNEDPKFLDWESYNFRPDTLSPAEDAGDPAMVNLPVLFYDLDNNSRTEDAAPDIGAYESTW